MFDSSYNNIKQMMMLIIMFVDRVHYLSCKSIEKSFHMRRLYLFIWHNQWYEILITFIKFSSPNLLLPMSIESVRSAPDFVRIVFFSHEGWNFGTLREKATSQEILPIEKRKSLIKIIKQYGRVERIQPKKIKDKKR